MTGGADEALLWVVFSGETELRWLRVLKPGFRHCFVVLRRGGRWLCVDPMAHRIDISEVACPEAFDLPRWLAGQGYRVVAAAPRRGPVRPAPLMPLTCVEAVKRLLGLHARGVVTPWQLFRHLIHSHDKKDIAMGRLVSPLLSVPKAAAPQPDPAPSVPAVDPAAAAEEAQRQQEEERSRRRAANLLERDQGMAGLVRTGFRGLLSVPAVTSATKTLLGE